VLVPSMRLEQVAYHRKSWVHYNYLFMCGCCL